MAEFRLTGKHVLAALIGFFAMIVIANTIFITLAIRSFPGEQEKKSYMQGLKFNERLAAREAQDALGWTVEIAEIERASDRAKITLAYKTAAGAPISGLSVRGALGRPATHERDFKLEFVELAPGAYTAAIDNIGAGQWRFMVDARGAGAESFAFNTKLILE